MSNTVKEYFGSKGWLTRYARAEDSRGMWQKYVDEVESNKVQEPRTMELAELPRSEWDNMNTPDLEQTPDSVLQPGQTLEDDFDVSFRKANAEGGVQQLVSNTDDGSRPGYKGPGQPKNYNLEQVTNAINNANSKIEFTTLKDLAKGLDGVSSASHLEVIIKRNKLEKLEPYATKVEKAFIELFKDPTKNADELFKPLYKIADMMGVAEGKERPRIESISKALKESKILNYDENVKPLIDKLSNTNYIEKIKRANENNPDKPWTKADVDSSIATKTSLKGPTKDAERLMQYAIRHNTQAGGKATFKIIDNKSGKIITDMSKIDRYLDVSFKDPSGKLYDMDYLERNGRKDPLFKEYFKVQDELADMKGRTTWPDGSKILDQNGKNVSFQKYAGSMYKHGYGYKNPFERFPYDVDHSDLKKHPFNNLQVLPTRINVAVGAADRVNKPDIKKKIGTEYFRELPVDDLMMQEKALGEKILIFDQEGNHIGKTFKNIKNDTPNAWRGTTPYKAAKIKAIKPVVLGSNLANIDTDMFDFRKLPEDVRNIADITKKYAAKSPKFLSALKKAKGASKWTGLALATEPLWAAPFAAYEHLSGESPERMLGTATWGLFGETEKEELKKATGELGYATHQIDNYASTLKALKNKYLSFNDQNDPRGEGRKITENMYTNTHGKYNKAYNMFVDDQGEFDKGKYDQALNNYTAGLVQIDKFKKQLTGEREQKRIETAEKSILPEGYDPQNPLTDEVIRNIKGFTTGGRAGYMGGGIMNLKKK